MAFIGKAEADEQRDYCHHCRAEVVEITSKREWYHPHSEDVYCGLGDGSTAYPERLWVLHEAYRRAAAPLPIHRTEAGYPFCSTCDGGGCYDCTDPA